MVWLLLFLFGLAKCTELPYAHGVIAASTANHSSVEKFCVSFVPGWFKSSYAYNEETAERFEIFTGDSHMNGCIPVTSEVKDKAVVIQDSGHCSVVERAERLNHAGARLIVIARIKNELNVTDVNISNFTATPIVLINSNSFNRIAQLEAQSRPLLLSFYQPLTKFDGNIIVIFALCIFCIVVGSYWSLYPTNMKISEFWTTTPKPPIRLVLQTRENNESEDKSTIWSNIFFGIFIVGIMATMLLLLYFAYRYFVYVFIALFCVIASSGMYSLLFPIFAEITVFHFHWNVCFRGKEGKIFPFKVIVWLLCFGVTLAWFFNRHVLSIWPLQVFMGVCVCLNIIKSVPLPNFKVIAIIMVLLFVYDIFFVFITPLFTKDGISIMERVATGSSSEKQKFDAPQDYVEKEQIPLVIKVPYLQKCDILTVCAPQYGLIGFGDIVIPGLLTAYCGYFDTLAHPGETKWYYIISCVAYAVGLVITYGALIGMQIAQPALLYLVPCTLCAVLGTALKRGEIRPLWTGRAGVAAPRPFDEDIPSSSDN